MHPHWVQKWCSQIRNCLASRYLKWRCYYKAWHGHTPEMSKFRFHAREPIWCINFEVKQPKDMLCRDRFIGVVEDSGDKFTCCIRTEAPKPQILVRSNIISRRLKVGATDKHVSNNAEDLLFWLCAFIDESESIEDAKAEPNHPIPNSLPGTISNEYIKDNQKASFTEPIEAINVKVIDPNDSANDPLEEMLDVIPMHRSSIGDSHLLASDQEIFFGDEISDYKEENHESDDANETPPSSECPHVDQDIVAEFEHALDDHTFKEIKKSSSF